MTPSKIDCSEIRDRIPLFAGGDLDLEVLASVREHLAGCPECSVLAQSAARGREALMATLRAREPDYRRPALWAGIRTELVAEGLLAPDSAVGEATAATGAATVPTLLPRRRPLHRRVATWIPVAAAACLLLLLQFGDSGETRSVPGPVGDSMAPVSDTTPVPERTVADTAERVFEPLRRVEPGEVGMEAEAEDSPRARRKGETLPRDRQGAVVLTSFQ